MVSKRKTPTREKPPASTASSRFTILMEAMEQQNRATIEAVFSTRNELRRELNEKFDRLDHRMSVLEVVARQHTHILEQHGERLSSLEKNVVTLQQDVRHLADVVEAKADKVRVERLEERVTSLEGRLDA